MTDNPTPLLTELMAPLMRPSSTSIRIHRRRTSEAERRRYLEIAAWEITYRNPLSSRRDLTTHEEHAAACREIAGRYTGSSRSHFVKLAAAHDELAESEAS